MSDSEPEDPNLPPAEECDRRCKEFASITNTDTALAMFFLQDREWDLQTSLSDYYQSVDMEGSGNASSRIVMAFHDVPISISDIAEEKPSDEKVFVDAEPHRIRVISWNIDGLDTNNIQTRAKAVCRTIASEKPDVVFLQEVVIKNLEVLRDRCSAYSIILGSEKGTAPSMQYFTAMLLRRNTAEYLSHSVKLFSGSIMSRTILHVVAKIKGIEMSLLTSHLESTVEFEHERLRQMRVALQEISKVPDDRVVVFGGDLNLRDSEFEKLGQLDGNLSDVWEETGKRFEAQYTWDTLKNDNLAVSQSWKKKPRHRYDRLYYRSAERITAVYFELVGFQKDQDCKRFPSDHWGIMAHFNKVESNEQPKS